MVVGQLSLHSNEFYPPSRSVLLVALPSTVAIGWKFRTHPISPCSFFRLVTLSIGNNDSIAFNKRFWADGSARIAIDIYEQSRLTWTDGEKDSDTIAGDNLPLGMKNSDTEEELTIFGEQPGDGTRDPANSDGPYAVFRRSGGGDIFDESTCFVLVSGFEPRSETLESPGLNTGCIISWYNSKQHRKHGSHTSISIT